MSDFLNTLSNLYTLAFVITSMLSMGLSLTIPQIMAPLKNTRLVIMALVANFILVPAVAYILTLLIPMTQENQIGLILIGCAAGASGMVLRRAWGGLATRRTRGNLPENRGGRTRSAQKDSCDKAPGVGKLDIPRITRRCQSAERGTNQGHHRRIWAGDQMA